MLVVQAIVDDCDGDAVPIITGVPHALDVQVRSREAAELALVDQVPLAPREGVREADEAAGTPCRKLVEPQVLDDDYRIVLSVGACTAGHLDVIRACREFDRLTERQIEVNF